MRTLAIVERAYRGTVEQQYAHVLWLAHALHLQSPMTVLLRGAAAVYALETAPPGPLQFGGLVWGAFPDYGDALLRLQADGADVHVSASSLAALGLGDRARRPGVALASDEEVAGLAAACDRLWYL